MKTVGCISSVFTPTAHVRSGTLSCLSQSEASRSRVPNEPINYPDGVWTRVSSLPHEVVIISRKRCDEEGEWLEEQHVSAQSHFCHMWIISPDAILPVR